jgi:hypothetical protein
MNVPQAMFDIFQPLFIIAVVLGFVILRLVRKRRSANILDGPLMASSGMLGASGLTAVNKSEVAGFSYVLMTNSLGEVMVLVDLAETTDLHVLAYGDKSTFGTSAKNITVSKWLEPVRLEGNFPDLFHMYVSPNKQREVRQVFTSDIMAHFADFCRAYDFEIYHDSLYITQNRSTADANDSTTLMSDIEHFLTPNAEVLRRLSWK